MKRTSLIVLIIALLSLLVDGQTYEGLVLVANSKKPLPYANVMLSGSKSGTVTNLDGRFRLHVVDSDIDESVLISYVGCKIEAVDLVKRAVGCYKEETETFFMG